MDVYEKIDEMKDRLMVGETSRLISNRIPLYSEGVKAKLRNAEYALSMIVDLSPQSDSASTSSDQDFCISDKIHFYVDSFFAFLYSAFDVISQVINQKRRLGIDERRVSFSGLKSELPHGDLLKNLVDAISNKNFFKNLEKYRNCSTHRRQIFMKTETSIIRGTPGYTTTGDLTRVKRVLCDDPFSLSPTLNQDRDVIGYCSTIFEKVKSEIINISKII